MQETQDWIRKDAFEKVIPSHCVHLGPNYLILFQALYTNPNLDDSIQAHYAGLKRSSAFESWVIPSHCVHLISSQPPHSVHWPWPPHSVPQMSVHWPWPWWQHTSSYAGDSLKRSWCIWKGEWFPLRLSLSPPITCSPKSPHPIPQPCLMYRQPLMTTYKLMCMKLRLD